MRQARKVTTVNVIDDPIGTGPSVARFTSRSEVHPFEQRPTFHVMVDPESGGMTPNEADNCAVPIGQVYEIARSYAASPPSSSTCRTELRSRNQAVASPD